MTSPNDLSRVVRTVHQLIVAAIAAVPFVVVIFEVPVDKAAAITGLFATLGAAVTKVYNTLWPGDVPLTVDDL